MITEDPRSQPSAKATIAVIKGGPEFQAWFDRLQKQLRLPAALVLDLALVELAKAKGFEDPPPR
jgi:hypothetical protein